MSNFYDVDPTPEDTTRFYIGFIDYDGLCHARVINKDEFAALNEVFDNLLHVARVRYGNLSVSDNDKEIETLDDLESVTMSPGHYFESPVLVGDEKGHEFRLRACLNSCIPYLTEDWDELEQPAIKYCIENGIGW